jgi:thioredoxin reductase
VIETDALIIGAGPAGLFQAFQLGLQEIRSHVVDVLPHAGGQCAALYADKPLYDIPGTPVCTGRELVASLQAQVAPFQPTLHLGQEVTSLAAHGDGRWQLETSTGQQFLAKSVFIATGIGAFQPRRLRIEGIEAFEGTALHYHEPDDEAVAARDLVVVGGGEEAVASALRYALSALPPRSLTLLHRRDAFEASDTQLARLQQLRDAGRIHVATGQPTGFTTLGAGGGAGDVGSSREARSGGDGAGSGAGVGVPAGVGVGVPAGAGVGIPAGAREGAGIGVGEGGDHDRNGHIPRLSALTLSHAEGPDTTLTAELFLVRNGLSPRLGPLADWGLALERKQLVVDPATCATALPGIYAVGDVAHYPGKKKLILCGFHEATLAAFDAAERLVTGRKVAVEYTTTSTRLHRLLGVSG